MEIPVRLEGTSPGVLNGGKLRKNYRKLKVKALPANLPDEVVGNIDELKIGSKLYITTLENDAYKFLHPDNTVIAMVKRGRNSVEEETEEAEA